MNLLEFVANLAKKKLTIAEIAVGILWWNSRENLANRTTLDEIVSTIENAGFAKQNRTRILGYLKKDRRTTSKAQSFGISLRQRPNLDSKFHTLANLPVPRSNSFLPLELFTKTRGYIEKVVLQINASYDMGLYDCTAVMCRRLLETLIIETYESAGRAGDIKGNDSHFMMFSGLLNSIENDSSFNLGRDSLRGLKKLKALGDRSAHNRRYNARRNDLDNARDGIRLASEELLHLSHLAL